MQGNNIIKLWHTNKKIFINEFSILQTINSEGEFEHTYFERNPKTLQLERLSTCQIKEIQCTGLRDLTGKPIFEGDIIVIPHQYPFYDYKNKEDMKQDLNETQGEIKGESILNYIGIVEWIYSQWQYVYHCVNPNKKGISEGINNGLNDYGFEEGKNTYYKIIGNIYENPELLKEEIKNEQL